MLCVCVPPGLEEFFMAIGIPVDGRTTSAPPPTNEEMETRTVIARALAAKCRMERITS
jgi:hypothetical protein